MAWCVSYLSHRWVKYPGKNNLRKEGVPSARSVTAGEKRGARSRRRLLHRIHSLDAEKGCTASAQRHLLSILGPQSTGWCRPHSG